MLSKAIHARWFEARRITEPCTIFFTVACYFFVKSPQARQKYAKWSKANNTLHLIKMIQIMHLLSIKRNNKSHKADLIEFLASTSIVLCASSIKHLTAKKRKKKRDGLNRRVFRARIKITSCRSTR
jgi:hypothetical protein